MNRETLMWILYGAIASAVAVYVYQALGIL